MPTLSLLPTSMYRFLPRAEYQFGAADACIKEGVRGGFGE